MDFKALLSLLLYAINEEKESLHDLSAALTHCPHQQEIGIESISHSELSSSLTALDPLILEEIFQQLLQTAHKKTKPTKRNSLYLIDSSTFSLSLKRHQWASFRKTKVGGKLHLTLCFMDEETMYPSDFTLTNGEEQIVFTLSPFVKAEKNG